MLRKISQTQKEKYHLYEVPRMGKFIETESRKEITRSWEEGGIGNYWLMGTEFLFGMMKKF